MALDLSPLLASEIPGVLRQAGFLYDTWYHYLGRIRAWDHASYQEPIPVDMILGHNGDAGMRWITLRQPSLLAPRTQVCYALWLHDHHPSHAFQEAKRRSLALPGDSAPWVYLEGRR